MVKLQGDFHFSFGTSTKRSGQPQGDFFSWIAVHDKIRIRMHQGISFSICRIHLLVLVTRSEWRYRAENFFKRQILTRFFIVVYAKWANFQLCLYHGKNKLYSLKWRLCTRPPRLVGYYSVSSLKQQSAGETRQFGTRWKRQFGTVEKSVKSAPHFLSNINWVKIGKQEPGTPFSKLLDPRLMQQWFGAIFTKKN